MDANKPSAAQPQPKGPIEWAQKRTRIAWEFEEDCCAPMGATHGTAVAHDLLRIFAAIISLGLRGFGDTVARMGNGRKLKMPKGEFAKIIPSVRASSQFVCIGVFVHDFSMKHARDYFSERPAAVSRLLFLARDS